MFDINHLVQAGGLLAVGFIIFAESGILLGFFLPGDTLLFTAGFLAGQGKLSIDWLIIVVIITAIVGYQVGYYIGERLGPQVFKRKDGILFREEYLEKTEVFFDKYGPVTVVFARFIAHVRTFVSVIAGAGQMNKVKYFIYNVVGAVLWGGGLTMVGYILGNRVPNIDKIIFPVIIGALVIFYAVVLYGFAKSPQRRHNFRKGIKDDWNYIFNRKN